MPDRDASPTPPILPGALAHKPTPSLKDRLRGRRVRMPWNLPDEVFHQPLVYRRGLIGDMYFIGDPALAKHVLIDKVANYPKAPLELRLFSALFGQGLVGIDGDLWRKHRRTMAPAFDPRSVASYAPAMAGCAEAFVRRWEALPDGTVVDAAEEMTTLTLSIIARTMFHEEGEALEAPISQVLQNTLDLADFNILDLLPVIGTLRMDAREKRMAALFRPLDAAIAGMITAREASQDAPNDLLSRLIAARDETTGAGLSAREVRDEVITIFMAGHETTATAMAWVWYLLARHPHERARLQAELDQVLGGRTPGQADIAALPFTRRLVDECLRLFPPAPGMSARVAAGPDVLGDIPVKAGAYMILAPWVLQRHRTVWEDPERFDPDRFTKERAEDKVHRYAWMPFGGGVHKCIGLYFAQMEIKTIMHNMLLHYEWSVPDDYVWKLDNSTLPVPKDRLPVRVRAL